MDGRAGRDNDGERSHENAHRKSVNHQRRIYFRWNEILRNRGRLWRPRKLISYSRWAARRMLKLHPRLFNPPRLSRFRRKYYYMYVCSPLISHFRNIIPLPPFLFTFPRAFFPWKLIQPGFVTLSTSRYWHDLINKQETFTYFYLVKKEGRMVSSKNSKLDHGKRIDRSCLARKMSGKQPVLGKTIPSPYE